jgi:hypothetical protein
MESKVWPGGEVGLGVSGWREGGGGAGVGHTTGLLDNIICLCEESGMSLCGVVDCMKPSMTLCGECV